jgi:hypothetical protein
MSRGHYSRFSPLYTYVSAFLAFSGGARNCVGKRFAMLESVALLAVLVRRLRFEAVDGWVTHIACNNTTCAHAFCFYALVTVGLSMRRRYILDPVHTGVVQKPRGGMPMRISRR